MRILRFFTVTQSLILSNINSRNTIFEPQSQGILIDFYKTTDFKNQELLNAHINKLAKEFHVQRRNIDKHFFSHMSIPFKIYNNIYVGLIIKGTCKFFIYLPIHTALEHINVL